MSLGSARHLPAGRGGCCVPVSCRLQHVEFHGLRGHRHRDTHFPMVIHPSPTHYVSHGSTVTTVLPDSDHYTYSSEVRDARQGARIGDSQVNLSFSQGVLEFQTLTSPHRSQAKPRLTRRGSGVGESASPGIICWSFPGSGHLLAAPCHEARARPSQPLCARHFALICASCHVRA